MSKGARWQTVALGWTAAVVVTMLIAAWAISIVGHQLSSTVTLPKSATSESSSGATPPATPRPRPSANLPRRAHRGGAAAVLAPGAGSDTGTDGSSDGQAGGPGAGTTGGETGQPTTREPSPRPRTTSPPPTTRSPSPVTDQRAIDTAGGTAAFTCTSSDAMSLLYATSAPGYTTEPPRIRSASRIEVDFSGPVDQKIDARCDGGKVTYTVET